MLYTEDKNMLRTTVNLSPQYVQHEILLNTTFLSQ